MPVFKNYAILEIARGIKAFLRLDAGFVRGGIPDFEQRTEEQVQKPRQAQEHVEMQAQNLRRAQDRTERQARQLEQMRKQISEKDRRIARLENRPEALNARARRYVLENYGYRDGLPVVDLLDLLREIDEIVDPYTFLEGQALPTDIALLKGLARRSPDCRYLEIGSWRGESLANVAAVAKECVSISLSEEELRERGFDDSFIEVHGFYSRDLGNVRHIKHDSHSYDFSDFKNYFDLIFIDGDHSQEGVKADTQIAFDLLRSEKSAIVWHDYGFTPERINWQVFAGILEGCPKDRSTDVYHVSNTLCAMYTKWGRNLPHKHTRGYEIPSKTFKVKLIARKTPSLKQNRKRKVVVLDNVFPHVLSSFRIAEYNSYLERWNDAVVYSTATGLSALNDTRNFDQILAEYLDRHPQFEDRVFKLELTRGSTEEFSSRDLAYTVFLHNAAQFLDIFHERDMPFAFTLYPGGGFRLDRKRSDDNLRRVCSSPNFKKVIVTQKVSRDYLLDRELCDPQKIEFVYGGVFPSDRLSGKRLEKRFYGRDKDTFDVCFVAHKYMDRGVDKGYDVFVDVAKSLSRTYGDVFFHVVGSFDESDIDVNDIEGRIEFYGTRPTEFFPTFYSGMDIILSPNTPFVQRPGVFDGFPTGGCIEAGLCGVAVLCTDPLNQNIAFEDGDEIVIVPRDVEAICATIAQYYDRPEDLYGLALRGQGAFRRVFDIEAQMEPRLRILSELLEVNRAAG